MSNTRTISCRVACGSQNSDELRSKFNMFGSPYYIPLLAEEGNVLHLNLISIFVFLCASLLRLRSSLGVSRYRAHASRLGVSRYRAHASRLGVSRYRAHASRALALRGGHFFGQ